MTRIPVRDADSGIAGEIVGFTGGDYNQWAIVQWGERLTAEALSDLRVIPHKDIAEQEAYERSRKVLTDIPTVVRPSMTNAIGGPQTGRGVR